MANELIIKNGVNVSGGITATTVSATTYQNLPDNVTGNYLPLSGGTVSGDTTITANLTVSGNSGINWFSSNTSSDLVRITQTGNGNAFVVEDSNNPDSTPFIINTSGNTSIGSNSFFTTPGSGLGSKLSLSLGASGYPYSGLPISTAMAIESNQTTAIGLFSSDINNSQIYFGTPGDVFGAFLRWDFTNKNLVLSTANSAGKLVFQTGLGTSTTEAARIDQNGNMGIGLTGATQKLEVSGNTRIYGGITADTISATTANTSTLVINTTPTTDPTNNNVLVRDVSTGVVKQRDITSTLNKNYASFYDTGDQTGFANTELTMSANTSDSWNTGITLSANTRFVIQNPGVYSLAFSGQMVKTGGNNATHAHIWLYQNGLDVPNSASQIGFPSNSVYVVPAWNFFFSTTTPNEYVELKWEINSNVDNQLLLKHQPATGNVPAIPSLIVTINQVN